MNDLRVLVVIDRMNDRAGAEGSTAMLVRRLQGRGVQFSILAVGGEIDVADRDELVSRGVVMAQVGGGIAEGIRAVHRMIDDTRPELIHAVLFHAELVSRIAAYRRVPVLASIVTAQYSEPARAVARSPRKLELVRRFDKFLARRATFWMHSVSASAADEAVRALGVDRARMTIVHRGRDADLLGRRTVERRDRARGGLGVPPTAEVILTTARHEPAKRLDLLIEAFSMVATARPQAVLAIAGRDGSVTDAVKRQIDRLGLESRVTLLGERDDVNELLCAADVFAFSSTYEGLPGAVLEAMALQVPIVAFDIPTVREATGQAGVLVPVGDTDAFAEAVSALLDDPARIGQLTEAGRRRFEAQFTIERYADEFAALYADLATRVRSDHGSRVGPHL